MKTLKVLAAIFLIAMLVLIAHGIKTDCPNTAVYVNCGKN